MTALECTYKQYPNDKMIGVFMFGQPNLVVHDVELAKQIMIKDFEYFVDRRSLKTSDNNEVRKLRISVCFFTWSIF